MEFLHFSSVNQLFAKLRVFDLILGLKTFEVEKNGWDKVSFDVDELQARLWVEVSTDVLENMHYKCHGPPHRNAIDTIYKWQNVYSPFTKLLVCINDNCVTFIFK